MQSVAQAAAAPQPPRPALAEPACGRLLALSDSHLDVNNKASEINQGRNFI